MRPLGLSLEGEPRPRIDVLLSHLHLDHLQGLGFFRPLYQPHREIHIWGPSSPVQSLQERIATYLSPPLFPVHLTDLPARLHFHDAPEDFETIGSLAVRASLVTHQGPTLGYRIEECGRVLVYMPDHEPGLGLGLSGSPAEWVSGYRLAHRADVLMHDAQYADDEYPHHIGWGHSSLTHVLDFARKAEVEELVLFHHDPYRSDDQVEELVDEARRSWGDADGRIQAAWEGMNMTLEADGVVIEQVDVGQGERR
jgi:ribonuclease BN (tRNA processing enzyme)